MPDVARTRNAAGWSFDNSYTRLPEVLFSRVGPVPVARPELVLLNRELADSLGLQSAALEGVEGAACFSGNVLPEGAGPIAQAYAGHQFGHFTNLGDGRAVLLGEQITPAGGRFDIQLKGSGPTPYSRRGDGRAALGPMLREYIVSEAMHALGIPTTRSLAVVATGEVVVREEPLPGAVLTRVAASHIRVGTLEYAAAIGDRAALAALVAHTRRRHFPELGEDAGVAEMFSAVLERQAALVARWMSVGFIHGVMNTDNMALSGETIDYGPCAFMDRYDPSTVFSSIDRHGRYAYGNQPDIAHWNLARLAEALLPLWHEDRDESVARAEDALGRFPASFRREWLARFRAKIGLHNKEDDDPALIDDLLSWMHEERADFTMTFVDLALSAKTPSSEVPAPAGPPSSWLDRWRSRLTRQPDAGAGAVDLMRRSNPSVIPRNHRVEEALASAVAGDLSVMHALLAALADPFGAHDADERYRTPSPASFAEAYRTFCGT